MKLAGKLLLPCGSWHRMTFTSPSIDPCCRDKLRGSPQTNLVQSMTKMESSVWLTTLYYLKLLAIVLVMLQSIHGLSYLVER